jgi:hypothetical protein
MIFDILKIKHEIEEQRLIFGQKLEYFLIKKLNYGKSLVENFLKNKKSAFYGSVFLILLSFFIQSLTDIGNSSAANILGHESLLKAADFFKINVIIFTQILINFFAIISLIFSFKILERSSLSSNRVVLNLLILSFSTSFFFRNYEFASNDIASLGAIFLIFFYPLFSYFLAKNNYLVCVIFLISLFFDKGATVDFSGIQANIFPVLLFLFLLKDEIAKSELLKKIFFITIISAITASVSGNFVILQAVFLVQIVLSFYFIYSKINFKKDWIFLLPILLIFHFNSKDVISLALNLCCFWWVFVLFLRGNINWFYFLFVTILVLTIGFVPNFSQIFWIISAIIFALMIDFYQKKAQGKKFTSLFSSTIFAVLSYVIYINFNGIYNYNNSNDYINYEILKYLKDKEAVVFGGQEIVYRALIYSNKRDSFVFKKGQDLEVVKEKLQNEKNKLIIVFSDIKPCKISILEELLQDVDFREKFKDYKFLNSIIAEEKLMEELSFFSQEIALKPENRMVYNVEIYVKN